VYHGGGDIIGPLSACQKGGLGENEINEFEFDMPRKPISNDDYGKFEERDRMKHRLEAMFHNLSMNVELINSEEHPRRSEFGDGNLIISTGSGDLQPEIVNQISELADSNGWGFEAFMDGLYVLFQGDSYGNKYQGSL